VVWRIGVLIEITLDCRDLDREVFHLAGFWQAAAGLQLQRVCWLARGGACCVWRSRIAPRSGVVGLAAGRVASSGGLPPRGSSSCARGRRCRTGARLARPGVLVDPMDETVSHAMYLQPPHDEEAITADPAVTTALRRCRCDRVRVRDGIVEQCDRSEPVVVHELVRPRPGTLAPPTGLAERLQGWRERTLAADRDAARNRPAEPAAPFSGQWWSTPAMASLVTATRPLLGLGSVELMWQEDSSGPGGASIWTLEPTRTPRVWEIDGAEAVPAIPGA
jgi:hypothetical protein